MTGALNLSMSGAVSATPASKRRLETRVYLQSGQSFGELVALGIEAAYRETVIAVEACALYLVTHDELLTTFASFPEELEQVR